MNLEQLTRMVASRARHRILKTRLDIMYQQPQRLNLTYMSRNGKIKRSKQLSKYREVNEKKIPRQQQKLIFDIG
ncbi:unnamed protein product [Clavelina lepadiformis]|uniref:Uncharacterized protein n=1 Tax=Clavelina lepadiformis TaxID=159417 RepID=A0ABP0FDK4_CLALP